MPPETRPKRFVQEQIARFRTTSNSVCNVHSRIESISSDTELQEMEENGKTPNCSHNFKARNGILETGVLVKSHKDRNVSAERKVGDCFQWKANGQCSKGDPCSWNHWSRSGQGAQS